VNPPSARTAAAAIFAIAAVAVAGCGGSEAALGTGSSAPAPDAERVQEADRIALVVAHGSRVVEGAPGTPFTRTTFAVEDVLKGELPPEIVIQVIGGRLGDAVVTSPLQAFRRSARYILFLGPDNRVGPTIFPQAVLEVKRAESADIVEPYPRGIHLRGPPRLDAVLESIRRYLRTTGGSP
jgi:hypothetical protein